MCCRTASLAAVERSPAPRTRAFRASIDPDSGLLTPAFYHASSSPRDFPHGISRGRLRQYVFNVLSTPRGSFGGARFPMWVPSTRENRVATKKGGGVFLNCGCKFSHVGASFQLALPRHDEILSPQETRENRVATKRHDGRTHWAESLCVTGGVPAPIKCHPEQNQRAVRGGTNDRSVASHTVQLGL